MGLYTITTRADGTVLTGFGSSSDIFNADHLNHVTHTAAPFLNSWEEDLAQMQLTHAPTTVGGSVSLPAALKDDFERLRYQIARIKQKIAGAATPPFWYTATADFTDGVSLAPTAARIELQTAAQSIPNNVVTQVIFGTTIYDTASLAQPGSILRAPVTGVYTIGATFGIDNMLVGSQMIGILRLTAIDGTTTTDIASDIIYTVDDSAQAITVETVKHLTAGETIKLMAYQNSGTSKALFLAFFNPAMWMSLMGRG